ncbi:MAG: ABC transporter permease [Gammaproteobacteria bacterium]|nr:ABC transporter permease [Gammaproteobacteria bacterium]
MNKTTELPTIEVYELVFMLIPIIIIGLVMWSWKIKTKDYWIANLRMFVQLSLIGFVLIYLFKDNNIWLGTLVMSTMLLISAWISLRPLANKNLLHYTDIAISITAGTGISMLLIVVLVLKPDPTYQAQLIIPLVGLLLGNTMNSISLSGDRYSHEMTSHKDKLKARNAAFNTAMIPRINSLLAMGLVALPGTMTGQIISGVEPVVAARYQIMIMAAILISSAVSIMLYLMLRMRRQVMG